MCRESFIAFDCAISVLLFIPGQAPRVASVLGSLIGENFLHLHNFFKVATGIADFRFTEIVDGQLKEGETLILGIEIPEEQAQKKLPPGFEPGRGMR